jgi:hypothetical protein
MFSHFFTNYPFTAPKVRPLIRYLWATRAKTTTGSMVTIPAAERGPHATLQPVMYLPRKMGSV